MASVLFMQHRYGIKASAKGLVVFSEGVTGRAGMAVVCLQFYLTVRVEYAAVQEAWLGTLLVYKLKTEVDLARQRQIQPLSSSVGVDIVFFFWDAAKFGLLKVLACCKTSSPAVGCDHWSAVANSRPSRKADRSALDSRASRTRQSLAVVLKGNAWSVNLVKSCRFATQNATATWTVSTSGFCI